MKKKGFYITCILVLLASILMIVGCTIKESDTVDNAEDETLVEEVTVQFDSNGGTMVDAITTPPGLSVQKPNNPKKEGYFFKGWYIDRELRVPFSFDSKIQKDTKLYAKWVPERITVSINTNGGNEMQPIELSYTEMLIFPNLPVKRGYKFAGWFLDPEFNVQYKFEYIPETDITIYAKWIKNQANEYSVTLIANGGNGTYITSYLNKEGSYLPDDWTKKGYDFAGWYDNKDFTGEPLKEIVAGTNEDVILYAKWVPSIYTITLYDGSNLLKTYKITSEEKQVLPILEDKKGYNFNGWQYIPEGNQEKIKVIIPGDRKDIRVYATWEPVECVLYFELNDGSEPFTIKRDFGTTIKLSSPTRTNYDFAGWYNNKKLEGNRVSPTILIQETYMEFYAEWTPEVFNIFYIGNGGTNPEGVENFRDSYVYGTEYYLPTEMYWEGHRFLGWEEDLEGKSMFVSKLEKGESGNKSFIAKWEHAHYSIKLNAQGGNYVSGENVTNYIYGSTVYLPVYKKDGYDFLGWSEDKTGKGIIIDRISNEDFGNKDLYAIYREKEYSLVVYETEKRIKIYKFKYNTPIEITIPTREGYDYVGIYEDAAFTTIFDTSQTMPNKDIKAYVKWNAREYQITFDTTGGSEAPVYNPIKCGDPIVEPANPTKRGYRFIGWFENKNKVPNEVQFQFTTMPPRDLVLYARWDSILVIDKEYKINYISGGEQLQLEPNVYKTSQGAILPSPTKEGYQFGGWYLVEDFSGEKVTQISTQETGEKTFYAKWIPNKYQIKYILTTEDDYKISYYEYGNTSILDDFYTKPGREFAGWYLTADRIGVPVTKLEPDTIGNVVFYAKWLPVTYTITFHGEGGTGDTTSITYQYGEQVTLPNDWIKDGCIFMHWYYKEDPSAEVNEISSTDYGDKELYAKWHKIPYDITLIGNGGTGTEASSYTYQGEEPLPTDWIRKGYKFVGWYLDEELLDGPYLNAPKDTMGAITFYAKWENEVYNITLVGDGSGDKLESYTYGTEVILPTNWQKDGYVFGGWYTMSSCEDQYKVTKIDKTMTGDMVFYAKWIPNKYTLKFVSNLGTSINERTYDCGAPLRDLPKPLKQGYIFAGWYEDEALTIAFTCKEMPARDVTIYAKWEQGAILECISMGKVVIRQEFNPNELAVLVTNPIKEEWNQPDYIFKGWYYDENFVDICNDSQIIMDKHLKLYAKWLQRGFMGYYDEFAPAINQNNYLIEIDDQNELIACMDFIMFNAIEHIVKIKINYLPNQEQDTYYHEVLDEVFRKQLTAASYSIGYNFYPQEKVMGVYAALNKEYKDRIELATTNPESMMKEKVVDGLVPVYTPLRPTEFDSFNINRVTKEMAVRTSDQLFYAVQYGYKPIVIASSPADLMYRKAKEILRKICNNNMNEFEKTYAIFTWFVQNVDYDYKAVQDAANGNLKNLHNNAEAWHMEGVFNKNLAVCDGMSKAFTLMCRIEGITCIRLTSIDHAWNKVYIDLDGNGVKEWYGVDVTWGSTDIGQMGCTDNIDHFLFTDEYKTNNNAIALNQQDIVADTPVDPYKYATYIDERDMNKTYDCVIESRDELENILIEAIENRKTYTVKPKVMSLSIRIKYSINGREINNTNINSEISIIIASLKYEYSNVIKDCLNTQGSNNKDTTILYVKF